MYRQGLGGPQDYAEAKKWFLAAAKQGDAISQYNVGVFYAHGILGTVDLKLAYAWFHVAAEQGDEDAKKDRRIARAELDPSSLAEAQKLAEQYYKSYVEPFR